MHLESGAAMEPPAQPMDGYDIGIVGGGLAGLAAAVRLKDAYPDQSVVVVDKPSPQSNTQIAGQRYRYGIAGRRANPIEEITELLASRNDGEVTPEMEQFAQLAGEEMEYWQGRPDFVTSTDRPEWFGPQWGDANRAGKGRGMSVLGWYREAAAQQGIAMVRAEASRLEIEQGHMGGLIVTGMNGLKRIVADRYILAGGNASGRLFLSTNKDIANSAQELAFDASIPLVDSTLHMIHPFGNSDAAGNPRLGCFETDELADTKVYLGALGASPVFDAETTELLTTHQAHYHFPAIAKRFAEHGSVVRLDAPDGSSTLARVSHHYGHLGIATTDGVSVEGTDNLYAAGDAAGLGYWTNHHERFPGFALLKCLTDAGLLVRKFGEPGQNNPSTPLRVNALAGAAAEPPAKDELNRLRAVNSAHLERWLAAAGLEERGAVGVAWLDALKNIPPSRYTTVRTLSAAIAHAHFLVGSGQAAEPFRIDRDMGDALLRQTNGLTRRAA
jgi:hypothetical protein